MLSNIWDIILESNTFNFLVFVIIFAFLFKKINIAEMISGLQSKIEQTVEDSSIAKEESQKSLKSAQKRIEHLESETEKIIKDADEAANIIAEKIVAGADSQIDIIEKNADKAIQNDIQKTKKRLSNIAANDAIKLLENNVKNQLNENLHKAFIDEALTELKGINL